MGQEASTDPEEAEPSFFKNTNLNNSAGVGLITVSWTYHVRL